MPIFDQMASNWISLYKVAFWIDNVKSLGYMLEIILFTLGHRVYIAGARVRNLPNFSTTLFGFLFHMTAMT